MSASGGGARDLRRGDVDVTECEQLRTAAKGLGWVLLFCFIQQKNTVKAFHCNFL
jgi:hypothetical protein